MELWLAFRTVLAAVCWLILLTVSDKVVVESDLNNIQ